MTFAVVTGANRGIGLALVGALKQRGHAVLAACRRSSPELAKLGVEVVEGVDVATDAGLAALVAAVGERPIDLLVNNAGILVWGD
ncbi:MAG TPA: SDR family NAD(P)-dependent oxidoreductase, partial [Polyangiaceae bacterium]|nr:SDR family NAD(P)-dependent oxidoreductase [Polyangiaceae bacterium]